MAKTDNPSKSLCFVIGPIGKDGTPERKHADLLLHSVIKHVLATDEFKYTVKRADEDADPGMIGDRVVSDIINSDLVVADLTDLNPNAFYELGIRHSTEKPTIHIAKLGTALPFDNVAHRTIFVDLMDWYSIEAARSRLADSVRTILSANYKVSNPITQANASFRMRQSEDPRERVLADIQERMAVLENAIPRKASEISSQPGRQEQLFFALWDDVKALRELGVPNQDIKDRFLSRKDAKRLSDIVVSDQTFDVTVDGRSFRAQLDPLRKPE